MPGQNSSAAAIDLIVAKTLQVCLDSFGSALRAVVLTGSLARGEGTCERHAERWRLLGDADFFLVFHSSAPHPPDGAAAAARMIALALAEDAIDANVALAPVHPKFLARMPRHILTYELRACGRVLWGDSQVLSLVPAFSAADISHEDAWRMLANRIIEQLEAAATDEGVLSGRSQYATVKLFLDMATSYLIFTGLYRPAYRERAHMLEQAARDQQTDAPFQLARFAEILNAATAFKLDGTPMPYSPHELWTNAVIYSSRLWTWQLIRLTGSSPDLSMRELMRRWMRQMSWKSRFRGWASATRRVGLNLKLCLHWLETIPKGSPRYLTYAAATELFFQLHCLEAPGIFDWHELSAVLPIPGMQAAAPQSWQALADCIAFNYHQLLETTIA